MATTKSNAPEEALNYLREFGLDPLDISRDDWDATGYWGFARDKHGNYVYAETRRVKRWAEWPEGFNVRYFRTLLGDFA